MNRIGTGRMALIGEELAAAWNALDAKQVDAMLVLLARECMLNYFDTRTSMKLSNLNRIMSKKFYSMGFGMGLKDFMSCAIVSESTPLQRATHDKTGAVYLYFPKLLKWSVKEEMERLRIASEMGADTSMMEEFDSARFMTGEQVGIRLDDWHMEELMKEVNEMVKQKGAVKKIDTPQEPADTEEFPVAFGGKAD